MGIFHSLAPDPESSQVECPHNQILKHITFCLEKHHPFKEKSAFLGGFCNTIFCLWEIRRGNNSNHTFQL